MYGKTHHQQHRRQTHRKTRRTYSNTHHQKGRQITQEGRCHPHPHPPHTPPTRMAVPEILRSSWASATIKCGEPPRRGSWGPGCRAGRERLPKGWQSAAFGAKVLPAMRLEMQRPHARQQPPGRFLEVFLLPSHAVGPKILRKGWAPRPGRLGAKLWGGPRKLVPNRVAAPPSPHSSRKDLAIGLGGG